MTGQCSLCASQHSPLTNSTNFRQLNASRNQAQEESDEEEDDEDEDMSEEEYEELVRRCETRSGFS